MGKVCFLCGFRPSRPRNSSKIERSLHSLPAKEESRILWIKVGGLKGMVDEYPHLRICSAHFTSDDYIDLKAKEKGSRSSFLKPNAVPSVLVPHPMETVPMCKPSTSTTENLVLPVISTQLLSSNSVEIIDNTKVSVASTDCELSESVCQSISQNCMKTSPKCVDVNAVTPRKRRFAEPGYVNKLTSSDFATPRGTGRSLLLVKSEYNKKTRTIKHLQDRNRYLQKRIMSLKYLVIDLQEEGLMTEVAEDALIVHTDQLIPLFYNKHSPILKETFIPIL